MIMGSTLVKAQWPVPCQDSLRLNPYYPCGPSFDPVCACDGKTYTNECESFNQAGLNTVVNSGVCQSELYYYDFWPNPVFNDMEFHMMVANQQQLDAAIQIFDAFGNRVYFKLLNNLSDEYPYSETIRMSGLQTGMYVIMVNARGLYRPRKFIKVRN